MDDGSPIVKAQLDRNARFTRRGVGVVVSALPQSPPLADRLQTLYRGWPALPR